MPSSYRPLVLTIQAFLLFPQVHTTVTCSLTVSCSQARWIPRNALRVRGNCCRRSWGWTWALPLEWTQTSCSMMRTWTILVIQAHLKPKHIELQLAAAPATTWSVSIWCLLHRPFLSFLLCFTKCLLIILFIDQRHCWFCTVFRLKQLKH